MAELELDPDQPAEVVEALAGLLPRRESAGANTWWRAGIDDALADLFPED